MTEFEYQGSELTIFEKADRWKAYWSSQIRRWIKGDVLEVGAGIGANTELLETETFRLWTCLEPDGQLLQQIPRRLRSLERHRFVAGVTSALPRDHRVDVVLYIDVLEHIENDVAELELAAEHLNPGGALIVLAPAHQWLFTPFDASIGHFRRYSKKSLRRAASPQLREVCIRYLDAAGVLASLGNRLLLRQSMPTQKQILTWDRMLVPVSRAIDGLLGYNIGKSVLGVWLRAS